MAVIVAACCVAARGDEPAGNMQITTTKTVETSIPQHRVPIASIELLEEVTVHADMATLKQVSNWPEGDAELLAEFADLIVVRFEKDATFVTLGVEQIQSMLRDAGLNPASVNFAGAATCRVVRGDVRVDEAEALRDWVGSGETALAVNETAEAQPDIGAKGDTDHQTLPEAAPTLRDLRSRLIHDLSQRLNLPVDTLQVEFAAEDQKTLMLPNSESISVEPQRVSDLGNVSWLVTVASGGESKRVRIGARARAWIDQVVAARPLALRQTVTEADIETQRILADRMPTDVLLKPEAVIGQQVSRDLRPGTVLTGKMLAPVELVRPGQLVTVFMRRGAIEVKSVARALQAGSAGQQVKVKNEATGELFQVELIGPQTGLLTGSDPVADVSN